MLPSMCVGLFGPRRAGKSTLLKALLNNESDPTSEATVETRGLRLAHAEIYKCNGGGSSSSGAPNYYRSFGNMLLDTEGGVYAAAGDDDVDVDDSSAPVQRHQRVDEYEIISRRAAVSFVDCPGHMGSIPTMLKGIMMSDAVLILSRPAASFSDPPTLEVLAAAHLMGKTILVVQSRASTASDKLLEKHRAQIHLFTQDIIHKDVSIVEARALNMSSVGGVCRRIVDMMRVTVTERNILAPALLLVGASCVVDGPVTEDEAEAAAAAAAGDATIFVTIYGRLVQGIVSPADEVEVRPGVTVPAGEGQDHRRVVCHPIILKVSSVVQQPSSVPAAADNQPAGGGVLLALRATATVVAGRDGDGRRQEHLVRCVLAGDGGLEGHVLGHVGSPLPGVYVALQMKFWLVGKMLDPYDEEVRRVKEIEVNQELLLVIGTMSTYGKVRRIQEVTEEEEEGGGGGGESSRGGGGAAKTKAKAKGKNKKNSSRSVMAMVVGGLSPPTCARPGENILICRRLGIAWHLVGRGQIIGGAAAQVSYEQY